MRASGEHTCPCSAGADSVSFSPDGARLATTSRDGTVHVYALRVEDLVKIARSRLTRSLTNVECQKYLHVDACPASP